MTWTRGYGFSVDAMTSTLAGDFDYELRGAGYATQRRPDPRIAVLVHAALGDARTVINVGAGAGSYEPADRHVTAIEPSAAMRAQRPPGAAPAIDARAEALPFDDGTFDAAMATVTVHQWADPGKGLAELRRVSRGPVVVLTFDPDALDRFWLAEYAPELIAAERRRYPEIARIAAALGSACDVHEVPIPIDCVDGFTEAFYCLLYTDRSAWGFVDAEAVTRFTGELTADLASGAWAARFGHLRARPEFLGSLRLLVGRP